MLIKDNKDYCYVLEMEVRDYELDCEQIVNNANYLHYIEHTRHKFCQEVGVPFIELHKAGIDAVVRKIELDYISSLRSGDRFLCYLGMERKGPRFIFHQDIFTVDGTTVMKAIVTVAVIKDGHLSRGDELAEIFKNYLK